MEQFPFLELVHNVSVLLTLALIYHVTPVRPISAPAWMQQILVGVILGSAGIVLMYTPWTFTPGINFDTRSVLLGVSGLFFGTVPTLIAMIMTAVTRYYQGGAAMMTGILVILATGTVSIAWRHLRQRPLTNISARELYLFGVVIHMIMLLLMFMLPWETALRVLSQITLPVLLLYPLATTLLGMLMVNRLKREQSQKLVSESEARYRLLADNTTDVLAVLNVNTERWEYVSPSVERLLGYTVEEFLMQSPGQLLNHKAYALIKTQKMKRSRSALVDPALPDTYLDKIEQSRKDGSTVWVEVSTRYTRNQRGDLILTSVSRDITERKQAEDALRTSEENFRRVVEDAPIAIFIQTEWRFAYANQATLKLFDAQSESQLLGQFVIERFHPDSHKQVMARIKQLNEKGEEVGLVEETIVRLDGATAEVEVSAVPFRYNEKAGALVFMKDISEKKQATARAFELALERERTSMLTTFVQEASHEFRTPLSIMQANLYLLKKISIDSERNHKIEQIEQQIAGISRLVEMLTESTRLQNDLTSPMQTLDLNTLIGEVISNFQSHLAANALTLHRNLALEPLPVSGSSNRLYAVLRELMDNAIRFTPPGGSIYLRSICQDQTIVVEIQDTGPGIPNESLPHIFKHFYRQDRAHTTPGLGLGLSIVKSIVEGHGGQIEVESQPGSGSLFRILLPLAKVMSNE